MPNLDDERFEIYLKKFRPLAPAPLPMGARVDQARRRSTVAAWVVAAAAMAVVAVALLFHAKRVPPASVSEHTSTAERTANSEPLTLGVANRLLADSPSLQEALNSLETAAVASPIPKGRQSALAVLAEENLKP